MEKTMRFIDVKGTARFSSDEPGKVFLHETEDYAALIVGLNPGQKIPPHGGARAIYYVVQGEGWLTLNDERREVRPGMVMVAQPGDQRGMEARTPMIVLASRARHDHS